MDQLIKKILQQKFLGVTEYLGSKTNNKGNIAMLIYNKMSVSPLTTHLPLKESIKVLAKVKL